MKKQLLHSITKKDLNVQTFRAGGPGGQNQNKRETGVRIVHPESGAVGECREQRSQHQNKRTALQRLVEHPKFKLWNARKCKEIIDGITLEERVDKMMDERNLKVEIQNDEGRWVEYEASDN